MPELASTFMGFVPMLMLAYFVYWLDRYEKEPVPLLTTVFFWGAVIAAGGAYIINTVLGMGFYLFTGSEYATDVATGSLIAPVVEEILKGLAVMIVFLFFRKEFDSILDGIIYAGIAALGFAATENAIYIYRGWESGGWEGFWQLAFIRIVIVGWQHPFYTAFFGIGLAVARLSRNAFTQIAAPLIGLGAAIFTHSLHNTLATIPFFGELTCLLGTLLDWSGWLFMGLFILYMIWHEGRLLTLHLREEVQSGLITPQQYQTAASTLGQSLARLAALFSGRYAATSRFYQVCGELAHKKEQLHKMGDESGNLNIIARYRDELSRLAPYV